MRYRDAPIALFLKVAKSLQIAEFVIEELCWFLMDHQGNAFALGAPTQAVLEVAGSPAEPFDKTVERYVAASGFSARTIRSGMTAVHNLGVALLTTAPKPKSIAQRLQLPALNHPALACESASWLASHAPGRAGQAAPQ